MGIFSLVAVLLIEQIRPLLERRFVSQPLMRYAQFFEHHFNDGAARHGTVAWLLAVVPPVLATAALHYFLLRLNPLLALAWNIGILYLTMGFRQFSHYYTDIHIALRSGDLDRARALLAEWRGESVDRLAAGEVARLAIEEAILASHRYVFAVILWYVLLPGPAGAVLYRLADQFNRNWGRKFDTDQAGFGHFARRAFALIDWLPLRVTAAGFAIVGDFEDAIYCWRTQASRWPDSTAGIVLASGAGALGVRLGMPIVVSGEITDRPELGVGNDADAESMQSGIGLVWRTLVLSILLLTLLALASWVGS